MTKNSGTNRDIVMLTVAFLAIILYFTHVISGPVAGALVILGLLLIATFVARVIVAIFLRD